VAPRRSCKPRPRENEDRSSYKRREEARKGEPTRLLEGLPISAASISSPPPAAGFFLGRKGREEEI